MKIKLLTAIGGIATLLLAGNPQAKADDFSFSYSTVPAYTHYVHHERHYTPRWKRHWWQHYKHHQAHYCPKQYNNPHSRMNGYSRHDRRYW